MEDIFNEIDEKLSEARIYYKQSLDSYQNRVKHLESSIEGYKKIVNSQNLALNELRKIIAKSDSGSNNHVIEAIKEEIRHLHRKPHCSITPQWDPSIDCLRHIVQLITGKAPHMGVYRKREDDTLGWPVPDNELEDWGL